MDGDDRSTTRDRLADGRPQNARPRDVLGRPLPHGSVGVPRVPDDLQLPPRESLPLAQRYLDDGMPFHAHDVLEGTWKASVGDDRELWQGLAQLAVGLTHLHRGNPAGAVTLITRGRDHITPYRAAPPHGVAVASLVDWADAAIDGIHRGVPDAPPPPRLTAD
ncbi:DUF309 domain-containing protein [Rhodococcoides corynebacterioides]|uniref:DUF309 domain-containing protein n=1 Tax=Rhodococcoides corynebacterioides TaxID=53972 RepID=UPI000836135C|nr:DUF309 domain-containing protein [Rhodococcus corynebacterioides]MBY6362522.1 DUF309 domain-containing protein [Rhodococcus corynebacterioides]